jgi:hypothetical protein
MCGTEDEMRRAQRRDAAFGERQNGSVQSQATASAQMLEGYERRGALDVDVKDIVKDIFRKAARSNEISAHRKAERFRLGIMTLNEQIEFDEEQTRAEQNLALRADAGPPPADAHAVPAERQKGKAAKRREKQARAASKKYGIEVTADTLPLMRDVREFREAEASRRAEAEDADASRESALALKPDIDMFSRPVSAESDVSFDVKNALELNRRMKKALAEFDRSAADASGGQSGPAVSAERFKDFGRRAKAAGLRSIQADLEKTLRIVLAAGGVDFDTGRPAEPNIVKWAKEEKAAAIESFRQSGTRRAEAEMDEIEKLTNDEAEAHMREMRESLETGVADGISRADLPFAMPMESAHEYMKLKNAFDGHPDRYALHKDLLDRVMHEYLDLQKEFTKAFVRTFSKLEVMNDANDARAFECAKLLSNMVENRNERTTVPLAARAGMLVGLMRCLLEDRMPEYDSAPLLWEEEFGFTEARDKQRAEMAEAEARRSETIRRLGGNEALSRLYTADSLQYCEALIAKNRRKDNVLRDLVEGDPRFERTDKRVLRVFCQGYETDESGQPATAEDLRKKEEDREFLEEFISSDTDVSERRLMRMTDELLDAKIDAGFLNESVDVYIKIEELTGRTCYMENVINANRQFFDDPQKLPKEKREFLDDTLKVCVAAVGLLSAKTGALGIANSFGQLAPVADPVLFMREGLKHTENEFKTALSEYAAKKAKYDAASRPAESA